MPVVPLSGKQEVFVDAEDEDAEPIILRFKNRILTQGCITVTKTDIVPVGAPAPGAVGLPGWKMTVKRLNGTIAASGMTDANGEVTFKNLPYGPYIVVEEDRIGWESAGATQKEVVLTPPAPGADVACEEVAFENIQSPPGFCIEGYKIDANGHVGIPNWTIKVTPVTKGAYPNPDIDLDENGDAIKLELLTDGTGKYSYRFPDDDYRVPGAVYKVCEEDRDGWLPHTATCRTVYLPHKPGACVRVPDFVNQQVGHSESVIYGPHKGGSGSCSTTHTVVAGESLFGIGNYYGVSGSAMLAANPWVNNRHNRYVFPGDSVCIP